MVQRVGSGLEHPKQRQYMRQPLQQSVRRSPSRWLTPMVAVILLLTACGSINRTNPKPETQGNPNPENRLVVNDAILEQSDAQGRLIWKLQAKQAIYSQDRRVATVTGVVANLYEGETVILSLQADGGEVINDGERVILEKGIIVTDNRYGAVLEAENAEWQPNEYLLQINSALQGKYPNGRFSAKQGQYFIDRQELELQDTVDAQTIKPPLKFQGQNIRWQLAEEIVTADAGLTLQRYRIKDNKEQQSPQDPPEAPSVTPTNGGGGTGNTSSTNSPNNSTNHSTNGSANPTETEILPEDIEILTRVKADKGEVKIQEQIVTCTGNVLLNNGEPAIQFASGEAVWELEKDLVTGKGSVQITHRDEKLQFQGSQGEFNLETQVAKLAGGVRGVSQDPQATLQASQVDWNVRTQVLVAQGGVVYEQGDPRLTLTGDRATGQLNRNTLVVTGNPKKQVVTEVIP